MIAMTQTLPSPAVVITCTDLTDVDLKAHFPEAMLVQLRGPEVKLTSRAFRAHLRDLPVGNIAVVAHTDCEELRAEFNDSPAMRAQFKNPNCGILAAKRANYLDLALANIAEYIGKRRGEQPRTWAYVLHDGELKLSSERAPRQPANFFSSLCTP
jgi:hypothetical protein